MSDMYSNDAARLAPGTRLNGIFEIERRIASGGMGEIYRGRLIETDDAVAIKVMRGDLAGNETALALFRKEASALHHVHHEAIVRYYVFSSDPVIHCHYLVMEFVDGESLSALLRRGPLAFDAVQLLRVRLASGLAAAHHHGIIHRDVSPDNVIVPGGDVGRAKIIDFGIARSTRAGDRTIIGSNFAGKYNYVSPEQLGLFGGEVTAKSDIYSLGIVLAQCLSGQRIDMGGNEFEVVEKRRVVPDLRAVDGRYRPLLVHMLQPDPKDRPASMADVAAWRPPAGSSGTSAASTGVSAPPSPAPARRPPARRKRSGETFELFALVLLALLSCGGVGYYLTLKPASDLQPAKPAILDRAEERERIDREAMDRRDAEASARRDAAASATAAAERARLVEEAAKRQAAERAELEALAAAEAQRQRMAQEAETERQAEERARQDTAATAAGEAERQRVAQGAHAQREDEGRAQQGEAAAAAAEAERQRLAQEADAKPLAEERAPQEVAVAAAAEAQRRQRAEEAAAEREAAGAARQGVAEAAAAEAEHERVAQQKDAKREAEERAEQAVAEAERQRQIRSAEAEREAEERTRQEAVAASDAETERQSGPNDADTERQAGERAQQEAGAAAAAEAERQRVAQDADAERQAEEHARQEAGVAAAAESERQRVAQERDAERQAELGRQEMAQSQSEHQRAAQEEEAKRQSEENARQVAAAAEAERQRVAQEAFRQKAEAERQRLEREAALQADQRAREQAERRSRITRFVNNYEGGDCFFIMPMQVAADHTNLEGFGASAAPFEALDNEFKRTNGFEAYIGLHQVTRPQCAAVTFLSRTRNQQGLSPNLEIGATVVKGGTPLTGSVADVGDHHVELLLVGEDGIVQNFTGRLSAGEGARSFALDLQPKNPGPGQPQLLIAVVSKAPLAALKPAWPGPADEVFARALAEAHNTGQALDVSAKYFKLEN
jgi:hypothetical protein